MTETHSENPLVGLWMMVKYYVKFEDGHEIFPLGEDAEGYIYYSPEGFVSGVMMAGNRPAFTTGDRLSASNEEKAAAWDGYVTYAGFYELEASNERVIHKIRASLYPNWSGEDQYRYINRLENGHIELTAHFDEAKGVRRSAIVEWRRALPDDYQ